MIRIQVKTISPISISKHPMVAGRPTATQDYIPGTSLRGAVATKYLKDNPNSQDSTEFQRLFLSDEVKWGNLYPSVESWISMPLPITALSCKRYPGFLGDNNDNKECHGVRDMLIGQILYKYSPNNDKSFLIDKCSNNKCKSIPMDRYHGFFINPQNSSMKSINVSKRLDAHTAIDYETSSAKHEALFTMEVIEEDQRFMGFIESKDASLTDKIKDLLDQKTRIYVGNDRSRGFGTVEIVTCSDGNIYESNKMDSLDERLQKFQDALAIKFPNLFSIYLYSGAIVLDNFLCYQTYIDRDALNQSLANLKYTLPESVSLEQGYSGSYLLNGWNAVGKLPKHVALVIQHGSVFLFRYDKNDEEQVIKCLKLFEEQGIGERRNEGFGKIIVCHSFHQEASDNAK